MSKSKYIAIIVAACCIGVGLIIAFAGALMVGFNFTKLNSMSFEEKTYSVGSEFRNININGTECDVIILPSEDNECRIVSRDSTGIFTDFSVDGDTLFITRTDSRSWFEHFGIWWGDDLSVKLFLPRKEYESLVLKTVSGDITVRNEFKFSAAELQSTSGDILFSSETNDSLSAKTVSGNIKLEKANGKVKAVSTSGEIDMSDMNPSELSVKTTSGDIELSSVAAGGESEIESVSGDVDLDRSDFGSVSIKTVSGEVEGSLLSSKNFVANTLSGDVQLPQPDTSAGSCNIKTTSGDIEIRVIS